MRLHAFDFANVGLDGVHFGIINDFDIVVVVFQHNSEVVVV